MVIERYVHFNNAKLLKDKGFDSPCRSAYTSYGVRFDLEIKSYITNKTCPDTHWDCSAPTQQMAMDWLHDNHNLHINIVPYVCDDGLGYCYEIRLLSHTMIKVMSKKAGFDSPYAAREDAINYCLANLI